MERVAIPDKMEIRLTEAESELCTLLDGCTAWMREHQNMNTSCRIAGGWVRDKVRIIPLSDPPEPERIVLARLIMPSLAPRHAES